MALTGQAPSPADRIAAFMDTETTVDGVPIRVAELTGEPGNMVFCHPVMVHCAARTGRGPALCGSRHRSAPTRAAIPDGLADGRSPLGQGRSRSLEEHRGELRALALDKRRLRPVTLSDRLP